MLTPEELATIAETMQPHLDELNMWISQDMIRRFMARMGRGEKDLLSGTDQWQAQVYKEAGGLYEDLQKELHEFTGKSEDEIKAIFEDAGIRAWNADDIFYVAQGFESVPLLSSERMLNILTDCYQRTNNEVYNFTKTTANETQRRFIKLLDSTHMKVMSGAQSYTAAVKEAVNELANTQTEVIYPSGHKDTIETAVLRAVRTGVAQASGNMTLQGMEERDWDLIRVSAHLGARYGDGGENPGNHFWWQGKLYSRTGRDKRYPDFMTATGYGTGEGLCGWNCRHSYGPGDPDHNPYKEYDAEENKKAYDLSQKQRKIERTIRADKLKVKGLREAIDCAEDKTLKKELSDDYEKASARLSMHNAEYNHFCENNGLKRYEKQPIEHATVSIVEDSGLKMLVIEPNEGYKLRANGDNTYSTMQIMFSADFESLLNNYHAVPIDEPDEAVENPPITPTEDEEISDTEALAIITSGGVDNDES